MTRFLLPVFVALLFTYGQSAAQSAKEATPVVAPTIINGIPVYSKFTDFEHWLHFKNDTTYVINFWATWCKPCVEELPYFEQLHTQFKDQKVKVVLVSLDFKKDFEKKLVPFIASRKLQPVVVALQDSRYNDWIDQVSTAWGGAIPVTLVYQGEKKAFKDDQFANYEELKAMVEKVK